MSKIFGRKGQAALEFLTTYGWAFMVILVMIGALAYFGVLNPGKLVQDQCVSTAGIECKSYEIEISNNSFSLSFTNNLGKAIAINNNTINISYKGATVGYCPSARVVNSAGAIATVPTAANPAMSEDVFMFVDCTLASTAISGKRAGDKVKLDFRFEYIGTETGEFSHLAYGTVTATAK